MENFHERFSWKAWVIILLVLAGILFLLLIIPSLLFSNRGQQATKKTVQNSTANDNNGTKPNTTTVSPTRQIQKPNTREYITTYFRFSYPLDWGITQTTLQGGGTSWTIKPVTSDTRKAAIEVQMYDKSTTTVEKLNSIFRALKYQEKMTTVGAETAYSFSGTIPSNPPLHERVVITSLNTKSYKIVLSYQAATQQSDLESIFNEVITSFRLLKVDVQFR